MGEFNSSLPFGELPVDAAAKFGPRREVPDSGQFLAVEDKGGDEIASALVLGTIPLGGAGAGGIEVAADSRFRHISTNNNRKPELWIPGSPDSFFAVRIAYPGETPYCYILQRDSRSQNGELVPIPRIPKDSFSSRGIFPLLHFFAHGPRLPFNAIWMLQSPIIPFDLEASMQPLIVGSVGVRNRLRKPATVSVLFHLEHLCGRNGQDPLVPRPAHAMLVESEDAALRARDAAPPPANGVLFSSEMDSRDCDGQHCIAARVGTDAHVSLGAYSTYGATDAAAFWKHFVDTGNVPQGELGGKAEYGAVCVRFELDGKQERATDFMWSWHFPRFTADDGAEMGNGYTVQHEDAVSVARKGLKNSEYYRRAVADWQQRLNSSTLPRWLVKELINSARIFSRNGLYTSDGRFGLQASPLDVRVGDIAGRLYSSLGSLVFLPRFEEEELSEAIGARDPGHPERLCFNLGMGTLDRPLCPLSDADQMLLGANLVISAYRNYLFTGNLVHARRWFVQLRDVMHELFALDKDGDGFPEGTTDRAAMHLNAMACGLWLLALRCYAMLAYEREAREEAGRAEALFVRAKTQFENYFWDQDAEVYQLWRAGCRPEDESSPEIRFHLGQLAGEWQAGLLGVGPLHNSERVTKTLQSLAGTLNDELDAMSPNVFSDPDALNRIIGHAGCLFVQRDRVVQGLRLIERMLGKAEQLHGAGRRQRSSSLAIWHVFQSIHGVTMDLIRHQLRVMPRLPVEVSFLGTPVFTPTGLGWMKYRIERGAGFRQQVHFSFDSPTNVATWLLRAPLNAKKIVARCEVPDGAVPCTAELMPGEYYKLALVTLEKPINAGSAFSLDLYTE